MGGIYPTPEHVEYMLYPRTLALAEVAWSAPERKSWPDFHTRALSAVADLQAKGYHPFDLKAKKSAAVPSRFNRSAIGAR